MPSSLVAAKLFKAFVTWSSICSQLLTVFVGIIIWRKYLKNISDVPGPFLASFTRFWHLIRIFVGDQNLRMMELHDKHGQSALNDHEIFRC